MMVIEMEMVMMMVMEMMMVMVVMVMEIVTALTPLTVPSLSLHYYIPSCTA